MKKGKVQTKMGEENSAKPEKKFKTIYLNSTQKQQKSICEIEKKKEKKICS